ncbi:MAG TPA: anti-sigma factor [Segetibacter sp.]|jgi:hypothetical protein
MKTNPTKTDLKRNFFSLKEKEPKDETNNDLHFPKAVNPRMTTDQLTIPPARVWDKIEQILDQQDDRRKTANTMIATSFRSKEKTTWSYLFAIGAACLVAAYFWFIR